MTTKTNKAKQKTKEFTINELIELSRAGKCDDDMLIKQLSLTDEIRFVRQVVEECFDERIDIKSNMMITEYMPYYKDFAFKSNLLRFYIGNIKYKKIDELFDLCYTTGISEWVLDTVEQSQIKRIQNSIDELIDFRKQQILKNVLTPSDMAIQNTNELILSIRAIVNKISEFIDNYLGNEDDENNIPKLIEKLAPFLSKLSEDYNAENFVETLIKANKQAKA